MNLNIFIPQILREVWHHKLRSSLAIFCIAFGVFSVVTLSALGESFYTANMREMMNVADDVFFVWTNRSSKSSAGYIQGQSNPVTIKDVMELPKIFPNITAVSTLLNRTAEFSYDGKAYNKSLEGVGPDFVSLSKIKLTLGSRFINQLDVENYSRVTVIGHKIEKMLFKEGNALGKKFLINNIPFTVIGVTSKVQDGWDSFAEGVYISYNSYENIFGDNQTQQFLLLTKPDTNLAQFEQLLRSHFARKCHFEKNDKDVIGFWGTNKIYKFLQWFFMAVRIFLGVCGFMILSVGSIGVANIMFLIVTERTYEIGLRKALGATDRQILFQLLFEALVIIGVGGGLGMLASFFTITFLQHITLPTWIGVPTLSWTTVSITIFILALVGLITGFFPARRAANMDPVEALML